MRDLIKRILRESVGLIYESNEDIIQKLRDYNGTSNFINSVKSQIERGLSQRQIDAVKNSLLPEDNWNDINDIIKNKGIELYNNIINSNKKDLFKNKSLVSQPSDDWYNKNLIDLDKFYLKLKKPPEDITIKYNRIKTKLKNKEYYGFIEDGNWSILNKFNTNYTLWRKLIDETYINSKLTFLEKINDFFNQKPISEIFPNSKSEFEKLKKENNIDIKTFSLAEKEIIKDINSNSSQKIVDVINKTTGEGNETENKFKKYLGDKDIVDFSSPGNIVDMEFNVDLMVHDPEGWIPIQVKSNKEEAKKCPLLKTGINGIAVYPDDTGIFRKIEN
jgi:hypothetical protein